MSINLSSRDSLEAALEAGDLEGYLSLLRASKRRAMEAILASNGGHYPGACGKSERRDAWAVVLPEMSAPEDGAARVQRFDREGFVGHSVYQDFGAALEAMVVEGYVVPAPGVLDDVSAFFAGENP